MARTEKNRGGWRRSVRKVRDGPGYPPTVVLGLGLLVPLLLAVYGVYAVIVRELRLPAHHRGSRLDQTVVGGVAVGAGIALVGAALLLHARVFCRSMPGLERIAGAGQLLGGLVIVAGIVYAFSG